VTFDPSKDEVHEATLLVRFAVPRGHSAKGRMSKIIDQTFGKSGFPPGSVEIKNVKKLPKR